jgi:PTS system galactitol-specific IIB component
MQKRTLKILVACASGIATSTLAAAVVQEVLDEAGIDCGIIKGTMLDIPTQARNVDLVLTTGKYSEPCPTPIMSITPFITGINEEPVKKLLREKAEAILEMEIPR